MIQTYIICFYTDSGVCVKFERFSCKKLNTCINRIVKCYKELYNWGWFKKDLEKANTVAAHQTDYTTSEENKVWEISIKEFISMLEK